MTTVVVTGGSRGIGAATARALAARGRAVCIGYVTRDEEAAAVVADCKGLGVPAVAVRGDVAVETHVERLFAAADALGPVSGLVNNAGMLGPQCRVASLDASRIERVLAVNVLGAFLAAQQAVHRMATSGGGTGGAIVNVSSRAAVLGGADEYVDYAASKAALDAMTVGLAREVAGDGIRVNGVRPGLIRTDIHASGGEPGRVDRLRSTVPMGRGGEPPEVAEAIVWLLSDAASYVTGTTIDVAGGR